MKPICFMIMPYGVKPTQAESGKGVANIDFNALWDNAYAPMIEDLGYEPVRADQDVDALIVVQMIERLYFADLVLAEMTIPNGNVYYEVGVRHAARENGCVLLAADWSKQLFDAAQLRTIRYPLTDQNVGKDAAKAIRAAIEPKIAGLAGGVSPVFGSIKSYSTRADPASATVMKATMAGIAEFQGKIRATRALPFIQRMTAAKSLVDEACKPPTMPSIALAALRLLKDSADTADDWTWITGFVARLPANVSELEEVLDTNAFALANAGKPIEAIAKLEELISLFGATPERLGQLGGRYKRLAANAATPLEGSVNLSKSIDAYERGMEIDLNQYYCSSNLPRLYRQRNKRGDAERAAAVSQLVVAACERARTRKEADEWLRPTLLGAAFDAGDAEKAEELATDVLAEGAARWKLKSTMSDLEKSAPLAQDPDVKSRLMAVIESLRPAIA